MTRFVDVRNMVRWVADTGPETIIAGLIDYIESDFRRWESFDRTPRIASHTPFGVIELMPTSDYETYGFKYVNGHPNNPARGFQTVTAFGVLSDVHNGYPTFLSEMTMLTALRTAATSAMAAKLLARADSTTMAMIGAGSQAEFQALAFRTALGISNTAHLGHRPGRDGEVRAQRRAARLRPCTSPTARRMPSPAPTSITTCTADKALATVLTRDLVVPGVHINAIGGDCPGKTELEASILDVADVFVEFPPQTRIEGEIQQMPGRLPGHRAVGGAHRARHGAWPAPPAPSRSPCSTRSASPSKTSRRCATRGMPSTRPTTTKTSTWWPNPDDPKNLFGLVGALSPVS